ncbi:MAG: (d)CMP kinase [Saprospiraceae bacterium]|nr:(d)CMP kinase [Saprospiraceae bacterium]
MAKKIRIAIDGVSSSGKSTMAKQLAKTLGFIYIDTGAMYRAVTLFFLQNQVDMENPDSVVKTLENIMITFQQTDQGNTCFLNDINVEKEIRGMEVSQWVSQVSAIPAVRRKMVSLQREMGEKDNVVMDGRDIGTIVFPDADVKLYIHSPARLRAERRWLELKDSNPAITVEEIVNNLEMRDHIDSTREDSPLVKAEDAYFIDNTHLNVQEQYETALNIIREKLS